MDGSIFRIGRAYNPNQTSLKSESDGIICGRTLPQAWIPDLGLTGNKLIIKRFSSEQVLAALADTRVVMLMGPRQSGKTTLARQLVTDERPYFALDKGGTLELVREDPAGFVRDLNRAIIDEVQLAPDLLRAIKVSVDEDQRPGRFLLTGSANILTIPKVSESLAGRMELIQLFPLSRGEIIGHRPTFLQKAFSGQLATSPETLKGLDLMHTVLIGGYPEMVRRTEAARRKAWATAYVNSLIQRDVREIANIQRLELMPTLVNVLAQYSGKLVNLTQIGGQIGLDDKSTRSYISILEQLYLIRRVQPWFQNNLSRLIKTPKLYFMDSGLLAATLGLTQERIVADRAMFGPLLETFVFSEVMKQVAWMPESYSLYHYRDKDKDEVDVVIENGMGEIVGIEVKASATIGANDFRGLRKLAEATGKKFRFGVVLYDGEYSLPFGERMHAAPVSCLWG